MPGKNRAHPTLKKLFLGLQEQLAARLRSGRKSIQHPGALGGATEHGWIKMLGDYLPSRYRVDKAFVLDSRGQVSDEIDVVVYDRQYSPLLFRQDGVLYVPAESVYAVLEVKQELKREHVRYSGKKAASVRQLHRTSTPIVHAGGTFASKHSFDVLAGIVALDSAWKCPLGKGLVAALASLADAERINLGCALNHGSFTVQYQGKTKPLIKTSLPEESLITFFIALLTHLQKLGTVPALDLSAYARVLDKSTT